MILKVLSETKKVWFGCTAGPAVVTVESYYGNVVGFIDYVVFVGGNVGDLLDEIIVVVF